VRWRPCSAPTPGSPAGRARKPKRIAAIGRACSCGNHQARSGSEVEDEAVGKTIGRYKVLEKVGEGGCGVVYVAEQTEPVRRRVALKVIKLGMDTKQVVARFEAERQALAMMDHPNIAKVLDAGATENGRPYFVMELVRGIKITEYCDQEQPDHQGTP
jgi:serine/threonine protein kinase